MESRDVTILMSPTPTPRRKQFKQMHEMTSCKLEETVSFLDEEETSYLTRTMPLPRKPRQKYPEQNQQTSFELSLNSTTCHTYMNTDLTSLITPGLSLISNSSIPFNTSHQQIIKQHFAQSTLKVERYVKLKRPELPPPPPPKSKPDLIESLFYNCDQLNTDSSLNSTDTSSNQGYQSYEIGFERLVNNNVTQQSSFDKDIYCQPKIQLENKKYIFNLTSLICSLILFLICISSISLFQHQVHHFYGKFLQNSTTNNSELNFTRGSNLVKQTVLFCNGPYFSYQINNLIVLPFSLLLVIIFSFYNQRSSCLFKCGRLNRPKLLPSFNPFQRRNRLLVAALFCIIANEIFKMIESSMFESNKQSFNSTSDLLQSILNLKLNSSFKTKTSNTDLLRIGLGIEPSFETSTQQMITSTSQAFFMPSVLRYSKPKLPPRLNPFDFTTIATTSSNDQLLVANLANGVQHFRHLQNKSHKIVDSLNKTLNGSSTKTLFEVSMSLYQNEYVQKAMNTIFSNRNFHWKIILDKLETVLIMLFEVFVIGMRYYPLIGIMDSDSLFCLCLASIYMWADIIYNIAMTGLCEGLKLNISFDLLKDMRRIFGVGFILDAKEKLFNANDSNFDSIDTQLLFSTNRIVYSVVKSLPHFFCLSYVTVRFTTTVIFMFYQKWNKTSLIVRHHNFNLIYTRNQPIDPNQPSSNFDVRYVRNLFNKTNRPKNWFSTLTKSNQIKQSTVNLINNSKWFKTLISDEYFRFSTRIICTYTVCFTLLYYLTCFLIFYGHIFVDMIYFPSVYKSAVVLSTCLTSLICFIQLVMSMKQFKLHLRSLYTGTSDRYISPKSFFSNRKIATSSFNYAGYAVTYTCWGYIFLFILITFIIFQLATVLFFGSSSIIGLFLLVILLPFLISVVLIRLFNRFISSLAARFCFVQNNTKLLAVKNLKSYSLFLYFKFFYDCFTSMAFCLIRMLKSIFMGVLFMPRLDYSFMGRGLEKMDPAFMSYIGYLHWESHHTNSIVISFCDLIKNRNSNLDKDEIKRNRIVNRWQLCYLLSKNRQLISYRRRN